MTEERTKRGPGRPRKTENRVSGRPKRTPVSGYRNILSIAGKDPDYEYRFVKDINEDGTRIFRFKEGGWDFVTCEEGLGIGEAYVYKTNNIGSVYRVPADKDNYYYLMKIRKEFYQEDQIAKEDSLREVEDSIYRPDVSRGQYGSVDVSHKR